MASFSHTVGHQTWRFDSLREVMAKASPARSGDYLAGVAAMASSRSTASALLRSCVRKRTAAKHSSRAPLQNAPSEGKGAALPAHAGCSSVAQR